MSADNIYVVASLASLCTFDLRIPSVLVIRSGPVFMLNLVEFRVALRSAILLFSVGEALTWTLELSFPGFGTASFESFACSPRLEAMSGPVQDVPSPRVGVATKRASCAVSVAMTVAGYLAPQLLQNSAPVVSNVRVMSLAHAEPQFQPASSQARELLAAAADRKRSWVELQHLRQASRVWAAACSAQPSAQAQLYAEDRGRLLEAASRRRHQYFERSAIGAGLVCLGWLGYHVELQKPRWGTTYVVGALSSLASGVIGIALEAHVPRGKAPHRLLKASAIHFFGGLALAFVMPMMRALGMPLAQLAAHHFVAASTLGKRVLEGWSYEWVALQLWLGAFICQLSWLVFPPTAFVVVLELVMGGIIALFFVNEFAE
eukprot:s2328_g2.t1